MYISYDTKVHMLHIVLKIIDFNSCILLQYKKFMVDLSLLLYSCHVNVMEQKTACHWKENIIAIYMYIIKHASKSTYINALSEEKL